MKFRQPIRPGDVGSDVLALKLCYGRLRLPAAKRMTLSRKAGLGFVLCTRQFQWRAHLPIDGIVGRKTTEALRLTPWERWLYNHARIRKPPAPPHPGGGQYRALVDASLVFAGEDQGIDFTGAGNVYAFEPMHVRRLERSGSGWPGDPGSLLSCHIDGRPETDEWRNFFYVAEDFDIAPDLRVGSAIKKGQKLGRANGKWAAPGIECGWADSRGHAIAHAPSSGPTPAGHDFNDYILQLSK